MRPPENVKGSLDHKRALPGTCAHLLYCRAEPGSIRGDFCIDVGRNVIHGSDAVESAQREIALWFPEGLAENKPMLKWIYESS